MHQRHTDKQQYYREQEYTTVHYVIPFISNHLTIDSRIKILEIGCGEGGNLKPFLDRGCRVTGVDIAQHRIDTAREFFSNHPQKDKLTLVAEDIYKAGETIDHDFDLIILRDVIEHIPSQQRFMAMLKGYIGPGGMVFFAFPPWQNPFGGHQQICKSKVLSKLPYFHLLPAGLYRAVLRLAGEPDDKIQCLMDIKNTGISIDRFLRILKRENYYILEQTLFIINPNYYIKFGLKPLRQLPFISMLAVLRNFLSTAGYFLITLNDEHHESAHRPPVNP